MRSPSHHHSLLLWLWPCSPVQAQEVDVVEEVHEEAGTGGGDGAGADDGAVAIAGEGVITGQMLTEEEQDGFPDFGGSSDEG
jgi:hypothetical protein